MNYFDQFDKPKSGEGGNYFAQFDTGSKPPEESGDFTRGAKVAIGQTVPILKGLVGLAGATAENTLGEGGFSTAVKNWGLKGYTEGMDKLQPLQKDTDELTTAWEKAKEGNLGALLDWAQYGLGYAVAQGGEAMLTALIGGAVGGAASGGIGAGPGALAGLVGKGAVKDGATTLIQRAVVKEASLLVERSAGQLTADEAVIQATKAVAKNIGSTSALLAYSGAQELGSIYPEAEAEAAKHDRKLDGADLARVWAAGIIAGGVEGLTDKLGVDAALGKIRVGGSRSRLGQAGLTAGAGVLTEGATEALQTGIERVGAGQEVFSPEGIKDIINSAGMGALGGGAIGGAAGLLHGGKRGDPVAVERSNQAMDDIGGAPDANAAIDAFNRTHIPLKVPETFNADAAMARMESMRDADVAGLRDFSGSTPRVTTAPGEPAPEAPNDIERMQAKVPEGFQDRLAVAREKLADSRNRQQIRELSGSTALGDALYFAGQADNDQLHGKVSDDMLKHVERILSDSHVSELPRVIQSQAKAETLAEKRLAAQAKIDEENKTKEPTAPPAARTQEIAAAAAAPARGLKERADAMRTRQKAALLTGKAVVNEQGLLEPLPKVESAAAPSVIDTRAAEAAASVTNDRKPPTPDQAEAGNYKKGHDATTFPGLDLSIENPEGSTRRDSKNDPPKWETKMAHHYGYIKGTKSIDGEHMDVFVKPGTPEGSTGPVFIVDQIDPATGKPDEHKVMLGFATVDEAKAAYRANYPKDWKGMRAISAAPFAEFKQWLATGDTSKPFDKTVAASGTLKERADAMKARTAAKKADESRVNPPATVAPPLSAKAYADMTPAEQASYDRQNGIEPGRRDEVATKLTKIEAQNAATRQSEAVASTTPGDVIKNTAGIAPALKRKIIAPIRGSNALGQISARLNGISPDLLADLSEKVTRTRTSKAGKKTTYTTFDNPLHQGHGPLFRKSGSADMSEIARVLEEEGFIAPGTENPERRAEEIIKAELKGGGSTLQEGNPDAVEAEMQRRRDMADDVPDDLFDVLTPDELEESGYAAASPEVKAATERLLADAEALGLDTEALRESAARGIDEQSEDFYHARLQEAVREAIAGNRRDAGQDDTGAASRSGQDRGQVAGDQGEENAQRAADLIGEFRQRFGVMPSGMTGDEYDRFIDERREADNKLDSEILALAKRGNGLLLPQKWGHGFIALHADPRTEGAWRITRFTDDMVPSGHMEFDRPAQAAGEFASDAKGNNAVPDLTLTAPTRAQVLAQQDALEAERADKEAPADKPRSKLTGEQVDIFNPQGSVFDAPAEAAPVAPEDKFLTELFGTADEQAAAQARFEAGAAEKKRGMARVRDAIASEMQRAQAEHDDWAGRVYKDNKSQIELRGDGPSSRESLSIGAINESRRRNAMDALAQEIAALKKLAEAVATDSGVERVLANLIALQGKADIAEKSGNWPGMTADSLFESMLLDDLKFRGPGGKGNITSNGLSKAMLAVVKTAESDGAPARTSTLRERADAMKAANAEAKQKNEAPAFEAFIASVRDPVLIELRKRASVLKSILECLQ